jgi:serine phosphatase RsbU (regulator of sigma subunit)
MERTENLPLRLDEVEIVGQTMTLRPGETLVLYSDGLTEIDLQDGRLLGIDGLANELTNLYPEAGASVRDLSAALTRRLEELQGSRDAEDDQTFLLAKRL